MITAIDVHTHPSDACTHRRQGEWLEQAERYFKQPQTEITLDQQADLYRERDMLAVVLALDEESVTGRPPDSNDEIAAAVERNSDVLIGFGSVDPAKGVLAVREVHRCVEDLGLRGMKFMPLTQAFFVDNPSVRPIFEACANLSVPVMIHTGTTGIGAGAPGGMGIQLKYGRPIPHLDDLAAAVSADGGASSGAGVPVRGDGGRAGLLNGGGAGEAQMQQMLRAEYIKYKNIFF